MYSIIKIVKYHHTYVHKLPTDFGILLADSTLRLASWLITTVHVHSFTLINVMSSVHFLMLNNSNISAHAEYNY